MDAAKVFRTLDLVPDRIARLQSGLSFTAGAASCVHPERLALLCEFLHWLSPIYPTTRDDQTRLGLFAAHKAMHAEADEDEAADETAELEEETVV
jgi:hypothetical protein